MKIKFLLFSVIFFVISCKKDLEIQSEQSIYLSSKLHYQIDKNFLHLQSGKFKYDFKKESLPFKKVIFLNSSLLGYISEINAENAIIGVSSPEYIYSEKIQKLLKEGKIENVGSEQKYDVEKIISLHPDAVFTNYIASFDNTYQLLKNNHIQVIFLDEYLEQRPLEKTAYLKLFGKLFAKEQIASEKYAEIAKNYQDLKNLALKSKTTPGVLANEMYGDVWYLPGGKTFVTNFIADANADYILKNNGDEKAVTMSFEEVFVKAEKAKFWVNAGNHGSKNEMLNINPYYQKLEVFNKGKIYAITAKEKQKSNDFFESGVVHADWVLQDYIKIFHPELLPNVQFSYMKELQ